MIHISKRRSLKSKTNLRPKITYFLSQKKINIYILYTYIKPKDKETMEKPTSTRQDPMSTALYIFLRDTP